MQGMRLGPYQVLAELGSGGMGTVYLARCVEAAVGLEEGAEVALKVIHPHLLAEAGFFKRFLREADIGRNVQHENVVRTFDCDATLQDGVQQNYLVMEFVEGQTLRDLLEELERVPEELCRHIGREVAQGLAAIHAAGVVHRDIKPENVLITEQHVVKVMDLGVARLQEEAVRLSQAGAFVGSLEYAAPEQFRSAGREPDGRADLHALGVLLYELATGRHPYRDEDASRVLHNVLEVEPRKAGELNPQLSPFFEEVVATLLAKDRDARFRAAADLAEVLREGEASAWWRERASALRIETKRPLRRIRIPRETALYGRDDDLARLHALYEQAKAGDGRVLLVEGEAGIGKTRLVDEFVGRLRQAGEDVNFLFGSYPPGGAATASGAFSEAYREHFGAEGLEGTVAGYLQSTPGLVPAFAALLRGDAAPRGATAFTRDSLQTVFVHATRALASERVTIVLIDDLHFAPGEGRGLFSSLAMAVPGHRILLLGTLRPGVEESWTVNVQRQEHTTLLPLARLGPKDLARLLEDAFHSERLAAELGHRIAIKCDGNPYFAFEIIRGLREDRLIRQKPDGTWDTAQVIKEVSVPSSIRDLFHARLGDLGREDRHLLEIAACCGFEFDPLLAGDVLGMDAIPVLQALGRIELRHRLVRSAGVNYVFDHHQVQEVLYEGLHVRLRREYHAAIGTALEARVADGMPPAGATSADLCEHFLASALPERALPHLRAALDHLEANHLNEQAIALCDRVLEMDGVLEGDERLRILLRKNGRLELLGRRTEQATLLEEATALATHSASLALQARVEKETGTYLWTTGRYEEALPKHERHLAMAREARDLEQELIAESDLGITFFRLGRFEEAAKHLVRCLRLAKDVGNLDREAAATINLGNCAKELGRIDEAEAHYRRGFDLAREAASARWQGAAIGNLGILFQEQGRQDEAEEHQERYLAIAREIGWRQGEGSAVISLGNVARERGRHGDAIRRLERGAALAREIGDPNLEAIALVNLGPSWLILGDFRAARECLEASLATCRRIGARFPEAYALYHLADLAKHEGDLEEAGELARASLALRRDLGHHVGVLDSQFLVAEVDFLAGRTEEARTALEQTLAGAHEQRRGVLLAQSLALLTRLGEPGADRLAEAREAARDYGTALAQYHLWCTTREHGYLQAARDYVEHLVQHAPEACRRPMVENVPLHREIMEAWAANGEDASARA